MDLIDEEINPLPFRQQEAPPRNGSEYCEGNQKFLRRSIDIPRPLAIAVAFQFFTARFHSSDGC